MRFAFLTFQERKELIFLLLLLLPPAINNRGLQTEYPLHEGLYVHAGLSQYLPVIILESNLQISGARSGLRVLAEVGSTFLLQQSPAPGTLPAWRG